MPVVEPGPYDNVGVGTLLFTLVDPHVGHEVAYNRWYERDHFYAGCLIGRGWFAGGRWVATRDLKELRFPVARDPAAAAGAESRFLPDPAAGSYLATYWIEKGMDAEAIAWGSEQVAWLHEHDRMFPERDHVHTLMYVVRWAWNRDDDGVPPALALDHRFPGLVTLMVDRPAGADARAHSAWLRDEVLPAAAGDGPIELVVAATPIPLPEGAPVFQPENPGHENRTLLLAFLDEDPRGCWQAIHALADAIGAGGPGDGGGGSRVSFAAPFVPTIPGTDTYTDQLW